jgi:hypothetical protein
MSDADLRAELEKLKAENANLKASKSTRGKDLSFKVSAKGACSVYGLGRFPVTLYKEQWSRLIAKMEELKVFLAEHDSELSSKE